MTAWRSPFGAFVVLNATSSLRACTVFRFILLSAWLMASFTTSYETRPPQTGSLSPTSSIFTRVDACRICGNAELVPLLDLGEHTLTGVFPSQRDDRPTRGPRDLVKRHGGDEVC